MENLLTNYRSKVNFINKLQEKKARLDKNKENRLSELKNKIPLQRIEIKEEAKRLYDQCNEYREKGFEKKYRSFMNQGSRKIKELDAISRYRKMKEIHNLNRNIRELNDRINALKLKDKNDAIQRSKTFNEINNIMAEIRLLTEKSVRLKTKLNNIGR